MGSCKAPVDYDASDRIYEEIGKAIGGEEPRNSMIALNRAMAEVAMKETLEEESLRELYSALANTAVRLAHLREHGYYEFQAEKDATQEEKGKPSPKATRDEPEPSKSD